MKKRVGRPTKSPKKHGRVSLGLKVDADTKRAIDAMVQKSGRSQSQEVELMIEQSLWDRHRHWTKSKLHNEMVAEFKTITAQALQQVVRDIYLAIAEIPCVKSEVCSTRKEFDEIFKRMSEPKDEADDDLR